MQGGARGARGAFAVRGRVFLRAGHGSDGCGGAALRARSERRVRRAEYAEQMAEWRNGIRTALVDRYGFTADNVRLFVDETVKTGEQGTAQNVRSALGTLRKQLTADDLLLIVFLGHGTFDGTVAKFNLIGPDLSAAEWGTLFNGLPGRLVVVNTTEASFHFSNGCPQPIAS